MDDLSPTTSSTLESEQPSKTPFIKFLVIGLLLVVIVIFIAWNIQSYFVAQNNPGPVSSPTPTPESKTVVNSPTLEVTSPANKLITTSSSLNLAGSAKAADKVVVLNDSPTASTSADAIMVTAKIPDNAPDKSADGKFGASGLGLELGLNKINLTSYNATKKQMEKTIEVLNLGKEYAKTDFSKSTYEVGTYQKVDKSSFKVGSKTVKVGPKTKVASLAKNKAVKALTSLKDGDQVAIIFSTDSTTADFVFALNPSVNATKQATVGKISVLETNESGDQLLVDDGSNSRVTVNDKTSLVKLQNNALGTVKYSDLKVGQTITIIGILDKNSLTASKILVQPWIRL